MTTALEPAAHSSGRAQTSTTPDGLPGPLSRVTRAPRWILVVGALAAQVALASLLDIVPVAGLAHVLVILATGLWGVVRRRPQVVALVVVYITGSEVMWRQTRAPVYHLTAPYLVTILALLALVMIVGHIGRVATLGALYFALLVPSATITLRLAPADARELIAFALSGPAALMAVSALTSRLRTDLHTYRWLLWTMVISSFGPLTVAVRAVRDELSTAGTIEFSTQSNIVTAGGFGPVQVSSALGLGLLAALLLVISERERQLRITAALAALALAVQTLLTFSRGGSYAAMIGLAALAVWQARDRRLRARMFVLVTVGVILAIVVVFPRVDEFTKGAFNARFTNTESSRTELAQNDTDIFRRNLAFGVGPGMTKYQRLTYQVCQLRTDRCREESSSHTEFTRMLGEHGIAGLLSMIALAAMAVEALRRGPQYRPFAAAWLGWAVAQMFYANLRIVAVPVAFAMAFLEVAPQEGDSSATRT